MVVESKFMDFCMFLVCWERSRAGSIHFPRISQLGAFVGGWGASARSRAAICLRSGDCHPAPCSRSCTSVSIGGGVTSQSFGLA